MNIAIITKSLAKIKYNLLLKYLPVLKPTGAVPIFEWETDLEFQIILGVFNPDVILLISEQLEISYQIEIGKVLGRDRTILYLPEFDQIDESILQTALIRMRQIL